MKATLALCAVLLVASAGSAAAVEGQVTDTAAPEGQTVAEQMLFHWEDGDWETPALFALLGLVGALVTMFSLIGGAVPGTAGKARIDAETARLDRFYQRLQSLADAPQIDPGAVSALNDTVDRMRDDLRRERWRQFGIGFAFYVVLGASFAVALAYDYLQAIAIGAGWTGYTGALGLKTDFGERARLKDDSLEEAEELLRTLGSDAHTPVSPLSYAGELTQELEQIGERMSIARRI